MKKTLMTLSMTVFLLSGIALVLLTIENKKDLSGRAYEMQDTEYSELLKDISKGKRKNEIVRNVDGVGNVKATLDPERWELIDETQMVFFSRIDNMTVHLVKKGTEVKTFLGTSYDQVKKIGEDKIDSWQGVEYSASFFGQPKSVEIWTSSEENWSVVVIGQDKAVPETASVILGGFIESEDTPSKVLGETTGDESSRLATISRPSVVMVLTKFCTVLKVSQSDPDPLVAGKNHPFCLVATGSGFFVNPDGYIATNGHVVKMSDEVATIYAGILSGGLDRFIGDIMGSAVRQLGLEADMNKIAEAAKVVKRNKPQSLQLAMSVKGLMTKGGVSLDAGKYNYYVQLGSKPLKVSSGGIIPISEGVAEATLTGIDYEPMDSKGNFKSSDVAIIKVSGNNFPALPMGDSTNLASGSSLEVIGYPGLVMGGEGSFLDDASNSEPSITRGVVSAIKLAKGDQKKLIQTDASINHGNSGGPALNDQGQVIGIATYGLTASEGSGNYNFLRDVADLKALAKKSSIELKTGSTYDTWKSGLKNYWLSYYKYAKSDFEQVAMNYPVHPTVDMLNEDASAKVGTPADMTPKFSKSQRNAMTTSAAVTMGVSLLTMLGLGIMGMFGNRTTMVEAPSVPLTPPVIIQRQVTEQQLIQMPISQSTDTPSSDVPNPPTQAS